MVYPIVAYGHSTLRKISKEIDQKYPKLDQLIEDMYETMYESGGVGLAAPQINKSIRLLVLDATPFEDEVPEAKNFKRVMINPKIVEETGEDNAFEEGCLSLPDIREEVIRKSTIRIQYYDDQFVFHDEQYNSIMARIIQHEYDHLEGVLFVDRLNSLKKIRLKRKLENISKGLISVDYKMIFPAKKKKRK